MILTEEEILQNWYSTTELMPSDGMVQQRKFARAIEQVILDKLRTKQPIAYYDGNKFYANEESASMCCADMRELKAVYDYPLGLQDKLKNAERYEWFRSLEHCNEVWCMIGEGNATGNLDEAIDSAMTRNVTKEKNNAIM